MQRRTGYYFKAPAILMLMFSVVAGGLAYEWVSTTVVPNTLKALADRSSLRRRIADLGIAALIGGFVMQFTSTYF
jgi:hypothetical protein